MGGLSSGLRGASSSAEVVGTMAGSSGSTAMGEEDAGVDDSTVATAWVTAVEVPDGGKGGGSTISAAATWAGAPSWLTGTRGEFTTATSVDA